MFKTDGSGSSNGGDGSATATLDDRRQWLNTQRTIHGADAIPEIEQIRSAAHSTDDDTSLLEAGAEALASPAVLEIGGRRVIVREPTVAQVRRLLGELRLDEARAVQDALGEARSAAEVRASAMVLPQIEQLMLDSLEFVSKDSEPVDRKAWLDELPISEGLCLLDVFTDAVDFDALIRRGRSLAGKVQRVRAHVRPPVAR